MVLCSIVADPYTLVTDKQNFMSRTDQHKQIEEIRTLEDRERLKMMISWYSDSL